MEDKKMVTSTYMDNKPDYVPHVSVGGAGKATGGGRQGGTNGGTKQMDSEYYQVDKKRTEGYQKQSPFGAGPTEEKTPQTGAHTSIGGGTTTAGGKVMESGYQSAMKKTEGPKRNGPLAWFGLAPPVKATPTSNKPSFGGNQKNVASNYKVKDMNKPNQVAALRSQVTQSQDQAQASGGVKVATTPTDSSVAKLPKGLEPSIQPKDPKIKTKNKTKKSKRQDQSYSKEKRVRTEETEESSSEESVDLDSDGTLMDIHSQVLDAPLSDHRWMKWDMDGAAFAPKDQLPKTSSSTTGSPTGSTATSNSSTNLVPPKATSTTGTTSIGVETKPKQEETTKKPQNTLVDSKVGGVESQGFTTLRTDYGDPKKMPGVAGKEKKKSEETRKKEQAQKKARETQKKKVETKSTPNTRKVGTPISALHPKSDPDKGTRPSPSNELLITEYSAVSPVPSAQAESLPYPLYPPGHSPVAGYDVAAPVLKRKATKGNFASPAPSPSSKKKGPSPSANKKSPSPSANKKSPSPSANKKCPSPSAKNKAYPYQVLKKSDVPPKDPPKP